MAKAKKTPPQPTSSLLEEPKANLTRRRDNRGSTRRIVKALEAFDAACVAFAREIDLQYFDADADGVRTGSWDFVGEIKMFQGYALQTINDQLYPPVVEDEADEETTPAPE